MSNGPSRNDKINKWIFIAFAILILIISLSTGIYFHVHFNAINPDSVRLEQINNENNEIIINREYGENLDLSSIKIFYKLNKESDNAKEHETDVKFEYVSNYDKEYLGEQEIQISFKKNNFKIKVNTIPAKLQAPQLVKTADGFSWNKSNDIETYTIYSGTDEENLMKLSENIEENYFNLNNYSVYGQSYFAVKACTTSNKYTESDFSNVIPIYKVSKATNINYEDGFITWNPVEDAESYAVIINDETFSGLTTNKFKKDLKDSSNTVYVKAFNSKENSISSISDMQSFYKLHNVEKLSYSDNYIKWDSVKDAKTYDIYINGNLSETLEKPKLLVSNLQTGIYEIQIIAKNDEMKYIESKSNTFACLINLDIMVSNNLISWEYLDGEYNYYLVIDGVKENIPLKTNSVDLTKYKLESGEHQISIEVDGNKNLELNRTNVKIIKKLSAPKIDIKDKKIVSENDTQNIKYYLNGKEFDGLLSNIIDSGTYNITAKYTNLNKNEIDSDLSNSLEVTKYKEPNISIKNEKIIVDNKDLSIVYLLDGKVFDGNLSTINKEGKYKLVSYYYSEDQYSIQSNLSNEIIFEKLSKPKLSITKNEISFDLNKKIKLYLDGKEFDGNIGTLDDKEHILTAKYLPSNDNELTSELSEDLKIKRLDKPIIKIVDRKVVINNPTQKYVLYLDGVKFDGDLSNVEVGEHKISAMYLASKDGQIESLMTTEILTQLSKPIINIKNGVLSSDKTHKVKWYLDGAEFDGNLDGINVGIHKISAKYISENQFVFESEISDLTEIEKLASPTISIENGGLTHLGTKYKIKYYLNGEEFNGDLSQITEVGNYIITAKYLPNLDSELISEFSNEIIINKLPNPKLSIIDDKIICDDTSHKVKLYYNGIEFDGDLSKLEGGNYIITAKYFGVSGEELDSEETTLSINKLNKPSISLKNNKLNYDNKDLNIKWYLDGVEFDGDLSNITDGTYEITAKYISNESSIISSKLSDKLILSKLVAPKISIKDDKLLSDLENVEFYIDGVKFNGDLSIIKSGKEYVITAIQIAKNQNELNSNYSNKLVINRILDPMIKIQDGFIVTDDYSHKIVYYLDGEVFDGDLSYLTDGLHIVSAKYVGSKPEELDSNLSIIKVTKLAKPNISVNKETLIPDNLDQNIEWYLDGIKFNGNLIDLTEGNHVITAKYVSKEENIIDSNISDGVTVVKLAKPILSIENNKLVVDDLSKNVQYYMNGNKFNGDLTTLNTEKALITALYLPSKDNEVRSNLSLSLTVYKLHTPKISIIDEQVVCDDKSKKVKYFIDDVEFDGDLTGIEAGNHVIEAYYLSSKNGELDSNKSKITIKKLDKPLIGITNDKLSADNQNKIVWYLNNSPFDGDLSILTTGTYKIKAKYIANKDLELNSDFSNELIITRLDAPTISILNNKIVATDSNDNIKYFIDGEPFSGKYEDIPLSSTNNDKAFTITAINQGNNKDLLSSKLSNELKVYKSGVSLIVQENEKTMDIAVKHLPQGKKYNMDIILYKAESLIYQKDYVNRNNTVQKISLISNGIKADKVKIIVKIKNSEGVEEKIELIYSIK